jgi:DNA-binding NtrC family response regulator/pSer/pThr/pTyr-binding forkhead associated (FHA) protein
MTSDPQDPQDPRSSADSATMPIAADAEAVRNRLPPRAAIVLYHRDGNTPVLLSKGEAVTIGRSRPADVELPDKSVSRTHARFAFDGDAVTVADLGSSNGTFVNGKRLAKDERARVGAGDEILLGSAVVVVSRLSRGDARPHGLESHDQLERALREEITRARHFQRNVTLVFVASKKADVHVGTFSDGVQKLLRDVDHAALYSATMLEILMPEHDEKAARAVAEKIYASKRDLAVGVAVFPGSATTADELVNAARDALRDARVKGTIVMAERAERVLAGSAAGADGPVVQAPAMKKLFADIERVARGTVPVLIHGETGAGKEVAARAVHERGARAKGPLVTVNCGALPATLVESILFGHVKGAFTGADSDRKGVFEAAQGGTLFLDEVGELPLEIQPKLLRALEAKTVTPVGSTTEVKVDARVVVATHRDLEEMCAQGKFRTDLLYRINGFTLVVPPLKDRPEEIVLLAKRFLASAEDGRRLDGFDDAALAALVAHRWPGNVRELRNCVERAVMIADGPLITVEDLPEAVRNNASAGGARTGPLRVAAVATPGASAPALGALGAIAGATLEAQMRATEANALIQALIAANGQKGKAADALAIPRRTFDCKLKALGIKKDGDRWIVDPSGTMADD